MAFAMQPNPNFALKATTMLASDTTVMGKWLNQAYVLTNKLHRVETNSIAALKRRNTGVEVKMDYLMEADITALLKSLINSFRAFIFVIRTLEQVEKAEGPATAGMHRKFMSTIQTELNTLVNEINVIKRTEARR
jgi:hypothetical protein